MPPFPRVIYIDDRCIKCVIFIVPTDKVKISNVVSQYHYLVVCVPFSEAMQTSVDDIQLPQKVHCIPISIVWKTTPRGPLTYNK